MRLEKWISYLNLKSTSAAFFSPGIFYFLSFYLSNQLGSQIGARVIDFKNYFVFFSLVGLIFVAALMLLVRNRFPGFFEVDRLPPRELAPYFLTHANECSHSSIIAYVILYLLLHFFYGSILFSFILFVG